MLVIKEIGNEEIAKVYIGKIRDKYVEFAESLQPPLPIEEKWVIIISCLFGCPVRCLMCDAGQHYYGRLNKEEIFKQIDYLVSKRFPDRKVPVKKFKVQFTRMGEPAFNDAVLDVLEELPIRFVTRGLMPSISTIGPKNCNKFFERLREIKNYLYNNGKFQMQFSIHTTDIEKRDRLIPVSKMSFKEIAEYGREFYAAGDRKITLNFIVMKDYPIEPKVVRRYFDPAYFIIKLTPLNPTNSVRNNKLTAMIDPHNPNSINRLISRFHSIGFETVVSIGNLEENMIGSNCGQYISNLISL